MKILMFCYEYPPIGGGGGVGARQYAEAWVDKGHHVSVITSRAAGLSRREMVNGVEVIRVATVGRRDRATSTFLSMLCYNVTGLLYVLRHRGELATFDVINTHFSIPTGPVAMVAARRVRVPQVLTIIGGDIYDPTKRSSPHRSRLMRMVNRRVIAAADRVVAISSDTKRRAEEYYGIRTPIRVINYGFRPRPAIDVAPRDRDPASMRLVSVGRLVSRKGYDHLIAALARLPETVDLLLIGDGPLEPELRAQAEMLGVAERVHMPGYQSPDAIDRHLRQSDCYVLSSLHEGLGIVVQEAMEAGLPVIATNNGGQVDLIHEGRNGLLVEPADAAGIAAAVRTLLADRAAAVAMGRNNAADIKQLYMDRNCELYLEEFNAVTGAPRRNRPDNVMNRNPSALEREPFDLVVIGGGIFGACAARDAAARGLSVALIDRADFCSATSAHSFKLIHGGIRYLQHADLKRVRQSADARRVFLSAAPHLARPLPIAVPTYGLGMKSKAAMRCAMGLYDAVTWDRNHGVRVPACRVPRGRVSGRAETLERYPGLPERGLTGAAVFSDGQMYNPTRLVLAFVQSAAGDGAVVVNHVEATGLLREGDRVTGVIARDSLGGDTIEIRGRVVLNAAGPYAEGILAAALGRPLDPPTPWSRDAYFVVDRPLVPGPTALALPAATRDPEAVLSRGERHLFLVPWRTYTLVGVWHSVYRGDPDEWTVSEDELTSFIDEINAAYTGLDLTLDDVSLFNAGLIPFGENDGNGGDLKFAHRSRLVDHADGDGIEGLLTLIGVRFTTGPLEASAAVDRVLEKLGRRAPAAAATTPVHGGDFDDFERLVRDATKGSPPLAEPVARALVHNHGAATRNVLELVAADPSLAATLGDSTVLEAEIVHAARSEMAVTLADAVLRRTDLGTGAYPGRAALERCARLMGDELGWDAARRTDEIERLAASYPPAIRSRRDAAERTASSRDATVPSGAAT